MSRPRSLDHVKRGQICALVAAGQPLHEVARRVGCSSRTIRRELRRNEDFRRLLAEAQESSAVDPLQLLLRAAAHDWRAAAWLLERGDPQQFAPRRPAPCRPKEFDEACTRLIEAALAETRSPEDQERLYRRLYETADDSCRELLGAPSARGQRVKAGALPPLAATQEMWRELHCAQDAIRQSISPQPPAGAPSAATDPGADKTRPPADKTGQNGDKSWEPVPPDSLARIRARLAQLAADRARRQGLLSNDHSAPDQ